MPTTPLVFRRLAAFTCLLGALLGVQACAPAMGPMGTPALQADGDGRAVLRISAIPDQNPEKLNRLYGLLVAELEERLGVPVQYVPVVDYTAAVTAFRNGDLDLVWFGGLTGVQARLQSPGAQVVAQRDIDARFTSVFIAHRDSGLLPITDIRELVALRGKRFSFGSESSTSGRLMPQHFLARAGVTPDQFAGGHAGFSGSHDSTLRLVESGSYEAGALNSQVWESRVREGSVDTDAVRLIWVTPGYPNYHWVARGDLVRRFGTDIHSELRHALTGLSLDDPRGATILGLFGATAFTPATAAAYAPIEAIGREIGKIR